MRLFNSLASIGILLLSPFLIANSHAKTFVLLSIDVETRTNGNPDRHIWGRFEGVDEEWGITKIMNILDQHQAKATFYLNPYEYVTSGEQTIKLAANTIHNRGQDLQLHTHPKPMFGIYGMSDANYEKQVEVLTAGIDLIQNWTGKPVIAHRAGAYRANTDTVRAARDSGLLIDASLAKGSPLAKEFPLKNKVSKIEGITELPVTFFYQAALGNWASKRHVDIEGSTLSELKEILQQASENGLCHVNIMMHSFSLSRYGAPDPAVAHRLSDLLEYIQNQDSLETTTTTDFYNLLTTGKACTDNKGFIPHTGFLLTYLRSVEDFNKGAKNKWVALGAPAVLLLLVLGLTSLFMRRRKRNRPAE